MPEGGEIQHDKNNRPLSVMCCMEKGTCHRGDELGGGAAEPRIPDGFPPLPVQAPVMPATYAEWEAEYTAMGRVKLTDVTLYLGEPVERYRIASSDYDELGVTTRSEIRTSEPGSWLTREFQYEYDLEEGSFTRTGPDGVETLVQLDIANRVEFVRRGPEAAPLMTAAYTYYDNGLVHTVTYGNGTAIEYTYDDANRLWTIDHRDSGGLTMLRLTYEYDRRDLPTFITEEHSDGSTVFVEFEHDNRGRLFHETRDGATPYDLWYEYDNGGNRTRKGDGVNGVEVVYHYDLEDPQLYGSDNNRLTYYQTFDKSGPVRVLLSTTWYYYNGVGNVTRIVTHPEGTDDYAATRLVYAVNGSAVSYVSGETWTWDGVSACPEDYDITYAREFRYDGPRQRYLNRELDADQLRQYGLVVSVLDGWSDYDGDDIYGDFTVDGSTVTNVAAFEPGIARSSMPADPVATEYYHHDHLGTTRLMSDTGSAAMFPVAYTAFGELLASENQRYGYVGAWGYQAHGKLPYLHVGYRYYDPSVGRFLQRDAVGIAGGLNVYEYVRSMPTVALDPDGLWNDPAGPYGGCGLGGPCGPPKKPTPKPVPSPKAKPNNAGKPLTPGEELEDVKKDIFYLSCFTGTTGAVTGALVGAGIGGPAGAVIGALVGAIAGEGGHVVDEVIHHDEPLNPAHGGSYEAL